GHMTAVFIEDANKLYSVPNQDELRTPNEFRAAANEWPSQSAVEAANEQGSFLFWNHSWWSRDFPNGIPVITDFHKSNIRKGLLHGIEIANGKNYSEDAFQIALDHNLALIGVSDVHDLIDWDYEPHKGGHRPVTLVFAEERTTDSMKEALFDRRTVVWFKNWLIGRERDLQPLLAASLRLEDVGYRNRAILSVTITNDSDADFHLRNMSPYDFHQRAATIVVPQHSSEQLMVRTAENVDSMTLEFEVLNAFVAPNETARLTLSAEVE
ncbi:MAG: Sb-PDE family phosphodiesterase, partial [Opitutales bacterium]|nr:Sb-PDE family phosphodiesterase [Opitutales bacterium]